MTTEEVTNVPERFDYHERSNWGPGPWDAEPDRFEWEHAGLPCMMLRGPVGSWCGYAAVVPGHPMFGKDTNSCLLHKDVPVKREIDRLRRQRERASSRREREMSNSMITLMMFRSQRHNMISPCRSFSDGHPTPEALLDAHGGVNYANTCSGVICHTPIRPGADHVWWFGFDTAHAFDIAPGMEAIFTNMGIASLHVLGSGGEFTAVYRTFDYVKGEVDRLAEQLRWLGRYTPKQLRDINRTARAERGY